MSQYSVVARNFSEASENRIHSDEVARRFGFRGALVPGVAVYGHLTQPLVDALGEDWLTRASDSVRLLKPTYHNDSLTIDCTEENGEYRVTCHNELQESIAVLTSRMPDTPPPLQDIARLEGDYKHPQRIEIAWDTVTPGQPFAPWEFTLSARENARYVREVDDRLALYQDGIVHPHLLLSLANTALMNEYFMPTWLHVGSETNHRQLLRVGDTIAIRSVPADKWRKKGHEFIRLWVTYWRDDEITTDIMHTAIFKVAG